MRVDTRSHLMYASRADLFVFYDSLRSASVTRRHLTMVGQAEYARSHGHGRFIANIQCPKTNFHAETEGLGFSFCDLSDCGRRRIEAALNWDVDGFAAEAPGMHRNWRHMATNVPICAFCWKATSLAKAVSPAPLTSRPELNELVVVRAD